MRRLFLLVFLVLGFVFPSLATERIGVLIIPPWYYEEDYQYITDYKVYSFLKKIRLNIYNLMRNTVPVVAREIRRKVRTKFYIPPGNRRKLAEFYDAILNGGECNGEELFDSDYLGCIAFNKGARVVVLAQLFLNKDTETQKEYVHIALQVYNVTNNVINTKNVQYPLEDVIKKISELELTIKRKVAEALRESLYGESVEQYVAEGATGGQQTIQGF